MGVLGIIKIGHKTNREIDLTARGQIERMALCLQAMGYTVGRVEPDETPSTPPLKRARRKKC